MIKAGRKESLPAFLLPSNIIVINLAIFKRSILRNLHPADDAHEGYLAKTRNVAEAVKLIPQVHTGLPAPEEQAESDAEPEICTIMSEVMKKEFNERAETVLEPA